MAGNDGLPTSTRPPRASSTIGLISLAMSIGSLRMCGISLTSELTPTSRVWPSRGASDSSLTASTPPAPALGSTITGWPIWLRQLVGEQPGDDVGGGAGGAGGDDAHGLLRPLRGLRAQQRRGQGERAGGCRQAEEMTQDATTLHGCALLAALRIRLRIPSAAAPAPAPPGTRFRRASAAPASGRRWPVPSVASSCRCRRSPPPGTSARRRCRALATATGSQPVLLIATSTAKATANQGSSGGRLPGAAGVAHVGEAGATSITANTITGSSIATRISLTKVATSPVSLRHAVARADHLRDVVDRGAEEDAGQALVEPERRAPSSGRRSWPRSTAPRRRPR